VERTLLFICALILLLDLAHDGALGKMKFVSASSLHKSSYSQCKHGCSDQVNSQTKSLLAPRHGIKLCDQSWPVKSVVPSALKKIPISLLGSAGGVPFKVTPTRASFFSRFSLNLGP
jgi:hypothetical protein